MRNCEPARDEEALKRECPNCKPSFSAPTRRDHAGGRRRQCCWGAEAFPAHVVGLAVLSKRRDIEDASGEISRNPDSLPT